MNLGSKLKAVRKARGLSLKELSVATNNQISVSFLSDIENGRSNPSLDRLKAIAGVLGTPIAFFLEDSGSSAFAGAMDDVDFIPVLHLLRDFDGWNEEDKKELLYYLKAKKVLRESSLD